MSVLNSLSRREGTMLNILSGRNSRELSSFPLHLIDFWNWEFLSEREVLKLMFSCPLTLPDSYSSHMAKLRVSPNPKLFPSGFHLCGTRGECGGWEWGFNSISHLKYRICPTLIRFYLSNNSIQGGGSWIRLSLWKLFNTAFYFIICFHSQFTTELSLF